MTKLDERLAKIESLLEQILTELRGGVSKARPTPGARPPPEQPPKSERVEPTIEDFIELARTRARRELRKRGKTK